MWSPHHPDLHSFPTRRSSDLQCTQGRAISREAFRGGLGELCRSAVEQVSRARQEIPAQGRGIGLHLRDRKSTRLNSSHGYISYAVFCLKKKKLVQCFSVDPTG